MNNPIMLFNQLYEEELKLSEVTIPSACCFSTIGLDGYPNSRFVSCKEILDDKFIITGSKTARKGQEVQHNAKVSLTFWWTSTNVQVRVQGNINELDKEFSHKYFQERNRESQIVSMISDQGEILSNINQLEDKYHEISLQYSHKELPTPISFAAWEINPLRIEFLIFSDARFHQRTLYQKTVNGWESCHLQP